MTSSERVSQEYLAPSRHLHKQLARRIVIDLYCEWGLTISGDHVRHLASRKYVYYDFLNTLLWWNSTGNFWWQEQFNYEHTIKLLALNVSFSLSVRNLLVFSMFLTQTMSGLIYWLFYNFLLKLYWFLLWKPLWT